MRPEKRRTGTGVRERIRAVGQRALLLLLGGMAFLLPLTAGRAQLRVASSEVLPLGSEQHWSAPKYAPDGKSVFVTNASCDGIWHYSTETRRLVQVTADPKSGYGFTVSADGVRIAYRRTQSGKRLRDRVQEIVVKNLRTGSAAVTASGKDLSMPAFAGTQLLYTTGTRTFGLGKTVSPTDVTILGIENTKIAVLRNGAKVLLDPFRNGSYVWPALSPDRTALVAVEMSRGAFLADQEGKVILRLGRRNAPVWTRDGRWIVYMDDRDDGHRMTGSDIAAVSRDGRTTVQLTSTPDRWECDPSCSPTEDRIVCATTAGEIVVLTYEEGGR